ncbi:MAG: aminotransferase class I/II-fold pyridoxal phosphate-dependent enzyme [Candidatus Omnitrophica bacterium]|nr:aminotransferase class I/II-fold pyridoxal phosphate-dependent enzyme [Candidatus Omnitrophota bacterium]MDD5429561.1 aminotransferase class I/II-fold pyridoxal phosphate-dependent enzyme [Candidatus Omnitrophota bacterium]
MEKAEFSQRLKKFPPYLFAEIDKKKSHLKAKGVDFLDLSIGDPDIPAPKKVVEALCTGASLKNNQKYALDQGNPALRISIQKWFKKRFAVNLDANRQILPLLGSKEGLVHFPLAFVNKGDYVIIPSPGYPGYRGAALFSGAKIHEMPLLAENNFLPNFSAIPLTIKNKAKIIYLNYPNNPTTALASLDFLKETVKFCSRYGIIIAYDNAYSEIYFDKKPHSILEIKGSQEIAIEFHSFSKTFCMTGFRIGWAAGNEKLLAGLLKVKTNIDSGIFGAVQEAGRVALDECGSYIENMRGIFNRRRKIFLRGMVKAGFNDIYADSTFYVWARIPSSYKSSMEFTEYLITKKGIVATPGAGFGKYGEGFVRFALTVGEDKLNKVFDK